MEYKYIPIIVLIMDSELRYKKQLEFYEYYEKQKENFTDLTEAGNNSIVQFAKYLFIKSEKKLYEDLSGILIDDSMDIADVFHMLMELFLHGFNILNNGEKTIFDLKEAYDDIIFTMKSYFKSVGFDINLEEIFYDNEDDPSLYRDKNDYYCEILSIPPPYFCYKGWYVLDYRIITNDKFTFYATTPIDLFKSIFISKDKKLFIINFKFKNQVN